MRKSTYSRSTWIWCADQFCRTFWKILFCWLTAWFVTCCMDICLFKSSFLIVWLFAQWCHVSFLHMANVISASSLLSLQVNVQLCRVRFAAGDARDPPPTPSGLYVPASAKYIFLHGCDKTLFHTQIFIAASWNNLQHKCQLWLSALLMPLRWRWRCVMIWIGSAPMFQ